MTVPSWSDLRARLMAVFPGQLERRTWLAYRLGLWAHDDLQRAWETATDAQRGEIDMDLCELEREKMGVQS